MVKTIEESIQLIIAAKPVEDRYADHNVVCLLCCESGDRYESIPLVAVVNGNISNRCSICAFQSDDRIKTLLKRFDKEIANEK